MSILSRAHASARRLKTLPRLLRSQSHSQYAEDAVLFAALNPRASGFYVDVGAHHPIEGSNTYRLYRHGWKGLTIEPNPAVSEVFQRKRPRDVHIGEGVSGTGGALTYYQYSHSVYNTFSTERVAELALSNIIVSSTRVIQTRPLREILQEYAQGVRIDLLSIDCEGFDLDVLETADLPTIQPTAVLVEDMEGYKMFQRGSGESAVQTFMRANGYEPLARALLSILYVSNNWQELFKRSAAFDEAAVEQWLLPGDGLNF